MGPLKNIGPYPIVDPKWNLRLHKILKFAQGSCKKLSGKFRFMEEKSLFPTMILGCIAFVFIALLFYVVILFHMKAAGKRVNNPKVSSFGDQKWKSNQKHDNPRVPLDLDPLFLAVHLFTFALFVMTYFFAYLA